MAAFRETADSTGVRGFTAVLWACRAHGSAERKRGESNAEFTRSTAFAEFPATKDKRIDWSKEGIGGEGEENMGKSSV
jgi:alpha-beta hydrolase superfamily lysophospholipase